MRHILIIFILGAILYGDVYGIYPARVGKRSASDPPPPEGEFPYGLKKKFNGHVSNHGNDDLDEGSWNRGHENYGGQYPGFKRYPTSRHDRNQYLRSDSSASQPDCRIPGNCPDTDLEFNTYSKNVINVRPGYDRRRSQQGRNQYDRFGSNQLLNLLPPPEDEFPLGLNAKLGQQRRRHKYLRSNDAADLLKSNAALLRSKPDLYELIVFATKPGEEHYNAAKQIIHDIMDMEVQYYAARFKVIQGRDEQEIVKRGGEFFKTKLVEFLNTHGNEFGKSWATSSKEW